MTKPRNRLISTQITPYYHCVVRCVRRAFLCGSDPLTGKNYDHRKQWTVQRLKQLASVFAIDICAYAVLSNHYHVVLHINEVKCKNWTDRDVVERWTSIFSTPDCIKDWMNEKQSNAEEHDRCYSIITEWRKRLTSISWFMRCMNETIARRANKEDDCSGRFWEGRFKSQALLDKVALLACMSYVDLNPVRAKISPDIIGSDYTSIQSRLQDYAKTLNRPHPVNSKQAARLHKRVRQQKLPKKLQQRLPQANLPEAELLPFSDSLSNSSNAAIPFSFDAYLDLVEQTGRIIREDKKGFIQPNTPTLLEALAVEPARWVTQIKAFGKMFSVVVGGKSSMKAYKEATARKWIKGAQGWC